MWQHRGVAIIVVTVGILVHRLLRSTFLININTGKFYSLLYPICFDGIFLLLLVINYIRYIHGLVEEYTFK